MQNCPLFLNSKIVLKEKNDVERLHPSIVELVSMLIMGTPIFLSKLSLKIVLINGT